MKKHVIFIFSLLFYLSANAQDGIDPSKKQVDKQQPVEKKVTVSTSKGKKITSEDKVLEYEALKNKQSINKPESTNVKEVKVESTSIIENEK